MPVTSFEVTQRQPFADGRAFGDTGSFTRIDGTLQFAFEPDADVNATVVDLEVAPRDEAGRVVASADVSLVVPDDPERGNGTLLFDVPNRGRSITARSLNEAGLAAMEDSFAPGDGLTFRRGFALASVAWQSDVDPIPGALSSALPSAGSDAAPLTGMTQVELRPLVPGNQTLLSSLGNVPYEPIDPEEPDAQLISRLYESGADDLIPRNRWRFTTSEVGARVVELEGGFVPGSIYILTYTVRAPRISGAGLLALRDAATFLRSGAGGELSRGFEHVLGFGVSQTGRVLRQMLRDGLTVDEAGTPAFDGLLIHIAGGMSGEFNHRFALPSQITAPSFGHRFPFAYSSSTDPVSGATGSLMGAARAAGSTPKVISTNSSWEYWRGDAGLSHIDPSGARDLEDDPDVRSYLFAGTQHGGGMLPQATEMPLVGLTARYGMNVVAHGPLLRAALINLDAWVRGGTEPPPSRVPRVDDGSAKPRAELLHRLAALPGIDPIDPGCLAEMRVLDLGPDAEAGVGRYPAIRGDAYTTLVSDIDDDLNEQAGIRLPDVTVPVGSHTGWNAQDPERGDPRVAPLFLGITRFFARTEEERAPDDPRPSVAARYRGRDDYLERVRDAAAVLVGDGYLLEEDVGLVTANCAERYDEALRVGAENPSAP